MCGRYYTVLSMPLSGIAFVTLAASKTTPSPLPWVPGWGDVFFYPRRSMANPADFFWMGEGGMLHEAFAGFQRPSV